MIRSVPLSATGTKRVQHPLPNPPLVKRPNVTPLHSVIGPVPTHHPNDFTPGGAPAREKPNQALTTSRFDDEFGDDFFFGTDLDKIIALTDMARKNSVLSPAPGNYNSSSITTGSSSAVPARGPIHQSAPSSMQTPMGSVPMRTVGPIPDSQRKQLSANQPPVKQPAANPSLNRDDFHDSGLKSALPFPQPAILSNGQRPPFVVQQQQQQPTVSQRQTQGPIPMSSNTPVATPTQHVIYNEAVVTDAIRGKDAPHLSESSLEEECNRLRTMYNECSQERGRLRLQQTRLQKQIDEKTNTVILLRSKLSSLESQLSKTRAEMAHRAAQKNDVYKAQHERLESQINSLNLERESLERELEESGRTIESLTRALSSERQTILALKRQLTGLNQYSRNVNSPEKDPSTHQPPSESGVARQDSSVLVSRDGLSTHDCASPSKKSSLSIQHNAFNRFLPKILSASLEDGLLELSRCPNITELFNNSSIENQIELLLNGSYPVFYAVPILKPIIDSGITTFMTPVLKLLCILVSHDSRSRQIILGPSNLPRCQQPQSAACFGNIAPDLVPNPLWPKPGSCLTISRSSMASLEPSGSILRSFYKPDEKSIATDCIECPGIVNSLMTFFKNINQHGSVEIIRLSLRILLELLRHAQLHQIPKFNALLDTGLLQSLFKTTSDISSQTTVLMIFSHLLWYDDNLRWFTANSSQPSALECAFKALELRARPHLSSGSQEYQQCRTLHLTALDLIGFILAKYGHCGVKVILYGSMNPEQKGSQEQQILPKIAAVMTAELDSFDYPQIEGLELIYKGISLIETLLLHVDVPLQTSGYRFHFLSLLTRIMQVGDDTLADHASCCRLQLIESGCLDLLSKPGYSNDSYSLSA